MKMKKTKRHYQNQPEARVETPVAYRASNMPAKKQQVSITPRNASQKEYTNMLLDDSKDIVFALGPAGTGKAQPLTAKIKVPNGWKLMGDMKIGDQVTIPTGQVANVTGVFPQGLKDVYVIETTDGRKTECCKEHLWEVFEDREMRASGVKTTEELIKLLETNQRIAIRRALAEQNSLDIELPLDPYVYGYLLTQTQHFEFKLIRIKPSTIAIVDELNSRVVNDGEFKLVNDNTYIFVPVDDTNSTVLNAAAELNLFDNPRCIFDTRYFDASSKQKLELFQGFMDAKLIIDNKLRIHHITNDADESLSIRKLGWGLGFVFERHHGIRTGIFGYQIQSPHRNSVVIKHHPDKVRLENLGSTFRILMTVQLKSITKLDEQKECQCIMIDSENHLYITDDYIVTHNTMLACQVAVKLFKEGAVDKIIVTRPAVAVDEEHGFLPGTLEQKMAPWTRPIFDVFAEYYYAREIENMIREGVIEVSPLCFMRGRTFKNAFIIADEIQNTTSSQLKMLLTRIGDDSRMVVTGDLAQSDRPGDNGLNDFLGLYREFSNKSDRISFMEFTRRDIERHPVITEILTIYKDMD